MWKDDQLERERCSWLILCKRDIEKSALYYSESGSSLIPQRIEYKNTWYKLQLNVINIKFTPQKENDYEMFSPKKELSWFIYVFSTEGINYPDLE